jgi:hypothetical protein
MLTGRLIRDENRACEAGNIELSIHSRHGMVIAVDPDTPTSSQRAPITIGGTASGLFVRLDGRVGGHGGETRPRTPRAGHHRLARAGHAGREMDHAVVTVR